MCCFVLNHQFLYFDKAAFHASAVADSSSCVHDGARWRALGAAVMQPLRSNKGLHCCHVKASHPRRAILHKGRILHDYAPQTRSNPIGGGGRSLKQTLASGDQFLKQNRFLTCAFSFLALQHPGKVPRLFTRTQMADKQVGEVYTESP